jgi:hypothetical protein
MKTACKSCLASALALALAPLSATAQSSPWSFEWNLRARHEQVSDDAYAREANAETLRLRAGLRFAGDGGWNGLLEAEGIAAGGAHDSGANGKSGDPQVVDPAGVELNQAFVGWKNATFSAAVGRQRLSFDNQRWVGNSGWRQNEQTFDALALAFSPAPDVALRYAFLDRVHRVNGDDALDPRARERALSTQLFNAAWKRGKQQFAGYAYLHEDRDVPSASSATWGLRWTGTRPLRAATFGWTLDAARQRDYAGNPLDFSHAYWLLEPALTVRGTSFRAGWEHLGGDGAHALQAPLGTLHAFDGWADKFLSTPANGLDDRYLGLGRAFGRERGGARAAWQLAWHDYRADAGGARYGREWDASLSLPLAKGASATLKYADYRADAFARDTRKLWLQLEYSGSR